MSRCNNLTLDFDGLTIDVMVQGDVWKASPLKATKHLLAPIISYIFSYAKRAHNISHQKNEMGLCLVAEDYMSALNQKYRAINAPTNILSFCSYDDKNLALLHDYTDPIHPKALPFLWGDVVLCGEVILREVEQNQKPILEHIQHLLIHGVLHLLGWRHNTDQQTHNMEKEEARLLAHLSTRAKAPFNKDQPL